MEKHDPIEQNAVIKLSAWHRLPKDIRRKRDLRKLELAKIRRNPYSACYPTQHNLCGKLECKMCFDRSIASDERVKQWSPKNDITPNMVSKNSNKKYIFICPKCSHEYVSPACKINTERKGCMYCADTGTQKLCNDDSCIPCFNRSFASHPRAANWDTKNIKTARQVHLFAHSVYDFICRNCTHSYKMSVGSHVKENHCIHCRVNVRILCDDLSCLICFNNSFASSEKSINWSSKNETSPRMISLTSNGKLYFFECPYCRNTHKTSIKRVLSGCGCGNCKNKTERKLLDLLHNNGFNAVINVRFDWCKNIKTNYYLPFDIVIHDLMIIIEVDGPQHFEVVKVWETNLKKQRQRDWYKMNCALQNGYSIIRVVQDDIWHDKNGWHELMMQFMERSPTPEMTFISDTGLYDDFENMFDDVPDDDIQDDLDVQDVN